MEQGGGARHIGSSLFQGYRVFLASRDLDQGSTWFTNSELGIGSDDVLRISSRVFS
jgi:hypothetical protein